MDSFDRVRATAENLKNAPDEGNLHVRQIYNRAEEAYAALPQEFLKELWETYDPSVKEHRETMFLIDVSVKYNMWRALFGPVGNMEKELPSKYYESFKGMRSQLRKDVTVTEFIRKMWNPK